MSKQKTHSGLKKRVKLKKRKLKCHNGPISSVDKKTVKKMLF
nr:hypothetical protein [Enterococcus sp. 665A]